MIKKIKNIICGTYYNIFKRNNVLAEQRMKICNDCPYKWVLNKTTSVCKQCGCILESKTRVKDEKCLINK